jgi:toxin ParE1/3/4
MQVIIAPRARRDIANILARTQQTLGPQKKKRYGALILAAIDAIAANPRLAGSTLRPEIAPRCRTYHVVRIGEKAREGGNAINQPRHFLLYRVTDANVLEIGRVLHDSMELEQHLPIEYRRTLE